MLRTLWLLQYFIQIIVSIKSIYCKNKLRFNNEVSAGSIAALLLSSLAYMYITISYAGLMLES